MKSFEQIAKAMFEAAHKELDGRGFQDCTKYRNWSKIGPADQSAWIAAAKEAHKQITEVH